MAGFLKKAQVYLGLGPDDEYEDYDEPDPRTTARPGDARDPRDTMPPTRSSIRPAPAAPAPGRATARPTPPRSARDTARPRPAAPDAASGETGSEGSVVRT